MKNKKKVVTILLTVLLCMIITPVFASGGVSELQATNALLSSKAFSSAIAIGVAAGLGALAMGLAIAKSVEGVSRQPEAEGKIRTTLMLGLVFIETAIIYALLVVILIIFVL